MCARRRVVGRSHARIDPDDSEDSDVTQSACMLYGLIHARYIISARGLDAMVRRAFVTAAVGRLTPSREAHAAGRPRARALLAVDVWAAVFCRGMH